MKGSRDLKLHHFLIVRWLDAAASSGWRSKDDVASDAAPPCFSSGWLVAKTRDEIVLGQTFSGEDGNLEFNNTFVIPRKMITEVYLVPTVRLAGSGKRGKTKGKKATRRRAA